MKKLILFAFVSVTNADAQVVECPKFYPWQDTLVNEVPYQHNGKGVVKKKELSKASGFGGEFNEVNELQGIRKEVKDGYDVHLPLITKWLVCSYGDNVQWWEELKLANNVKA